MRKRIFWTLFVLIGILACNEDPLPDPLEESLLTTVAAKADMGKAVSRPFKIKGTGTFEIVQSTECGELTQIYLEGQGNATHIGKFTVTITYCTDFGENSRITGTSVAANGDELYFYSFGGGTDEIGEYQDYIFEGGTGRFEDLVGDLRLYVKLFEFTSPTGGIYANEGEGTFTY